MRFLITGGPRTGKTTRAERLGMEPQHRGPLLHTDDLIDCFDWSGQSAEVATWFDVAGPWVIEGVAVPRALRKWLAAHANRSLKPADVILYLEKPQVELTPKQAAMGKQVMTVWNEVLPELVQRGVLVLRS